MCFEHDYDWTAEVRGDVEVVLEKPSHCYECGRAIDAGETVRSINQQEYEECQCDNCQDSFPTYDCPNADYGETFECDICAECNKILKAIESLEEQEGCPPGARQPSFGRLWEEAFTQDKHEAHKYAKHAVAMFPELATHRFIEDSLGEIEDD